MSLKTSRSITLVLILLILLVTVGTVCVVTMEAREALMDSVQDELVAVASVAASRIDGDQFVRIENGDENSGDFLHIRDQLREVREAIPALLFVYTMRKNGDTVEFVVDGDYGYADDAAAIGDAYPEAEAELHAGFTGPSVDTDFTTDQWGTVLSGFSPIRDGTGAVVGIVGVDMDCTTVLEKLDFLNLLFYLFVFIILSFGAAGVFFIEKRRILDEQQLQESEHKYRELFERANDCILIFEAEGENRGRIIAANRAAADLHGYTVEELLSMKITDLDSRESADTAPERFERILRGEVMRSEVTHVRRDGTEFPMEINGGLLRLGTKNYVLAIDRDISERRRAEEAFQLATKKLNLLNLITFSDIKNAMFSLLGYIELEQEFTAGDEGRTYRDRQVAIIHQVEDWIGFSKTYQDLGLVPPKWQNVEHGFLYAVSHLDLSHMERTLGVDRLEIYADSLMENVFYSLVENVVVHAETATEIALSYRLTDEGLVLVFEDNGVGIPEDMKEKIFERRYENKNGLGLFLAREILEITGIGIRETGIPGEGARFEITVPKENYRFVDPDGDRQP